MEEKTLRGGSNFDTIRYSPFFFTQKNGTLGGGIYLVLYIILLLMEPFRLYIGYNSNLYEKVRER